MNKYNTDGAKRFISSSPTSEMGRSSIGIQCPFCQTTSTAYLWSLAGSGKKCRGCGGLHTSGGVTFPLKPKGPKQ